MANPIAPPADEEDDATLHGNPGTDEPRVAARKRHLVRAHVEHRARLGAGQAPTTKSRSRASAASRSTSPASSTARTTARSRSPCRPGLSPGWHGLAARRFPASFEQAEVGHEPCPCVKSNSTAAALGAAPPCCWRSPCCPAPALAQYIGARRRRPCRRAARAGRGRDARRGACSRGLRTAGAEPARFRRADRRRARRARPWRYAGGDRLFRPRRGSARRPTRRPRSGWARRPSPTGDAERRAELVLPGAAAWARRRPRSAPTAAWRRICLATRPRRRSIIAPRSAAPMPTRRAAGSRSAWRFRATARARSPMLQPLLMRRDPAAQRIRAFVLALGRRRARRVAARSTARCRVVGARMAGFFRLLPSLSAPQKAAAVHLGVFPDREPRSRLVAASSRCACASSARPVAGRCAARSTPPVAAPVAPRRLPVPRRSRAPTLVAQPPRAGHDDGGASRPPCRADAIAVAGRPRSPRCRAGGPGDASEPARSTWPAMRRRGRDQCREPTETAAADAAEPRRRRRRADAAIGCRGSTACSPRPMNCRVPPAPPAARREAALKVAARDTAKPKKAAEAQEGRRGQEARRRQEGRRGERGARGAWASPGPIGSSSPAGRTRTAWRPNLRSSPPSRRRCASAAAQVTQGKDYFRLLTGPFDSKSAAQSFVNQLAKDGVDGFSWTRTPATIKIEKLSPK